MDQRHYADFNSGALCNQETMCQHLLATGKFGEIEDANSNPMTIRLLLTKEGLEQVKSFCKILHRHIEDPPHYVISEPNLAKTIYTTESSASGCARYHGHYEFKPPEDYSAHPVVTGEGGTTWNEIQVGDIIHLIRVNSSPVNLFGLYKGLYQYFTNYGSCLDRIRYEIEKLYGCPTSQIRYWSWLTNPTNQIISWLNQQGWTDLTRITTSAAATTVKVCSKHRNRLVHDGFLETKIKTTSGEVFLQDDPNNPQTNQWVEVSAYCDEKFKNLIALLDDIYRCMSNDL